MINDIYQQFIGLPILRKYQPVNSIIPENFQLEALIDGEKINRILVNLLSNAMKYANKAISIGIEKNDTDFSIWVEDDGPGISDNEKEKIFQTFYQIADEKSVQGSGIGLAYSLALAETHHGTLCVKDSHLGGAAFVLTLPIYSKNEQKERSRHHTRLTIYSRKR